MWNIEDFDIKANSRAGEWLQLVHPKTGEDLEVDTVDGVFKCRVKVLGPKSNEGIKAKADAERAYREHEAKVKRLEKSNKTYIPSEDDIKSSEQKDIEYCKAMVIDWEGMPDGKGVLDKNGNVKVKHGLAKFCDTEKDRVFAADGLRSQIITWSLNALNFIKS